MNDRFRGSVDEARAEGRRQRLARKAAEAEGASAWRRPEPEAPAPPEAAALAARRSAPKAAPKHGMTRAAKPAAPAQQGARAARPAAPAPADAGGLFGAEDAGPARRGIPLGARRARGAFLGARRAREVFLDARETPPRCA